MKVLMNTSYVKGRPFMVIGLNRANVSACAALVA